MKKETMDELLIEAKKLSAHLDESLGIFKRMVYPIPMIFAREWSEAPEYVALRKTKLYRLLHE
jgi:hypothetical protein